MFAMIEDGSRQYRVQEGDTLTVDFRADAEAGGTITFDRVLLANGGGASAIGRPTVEGATVEAEVVFPEVKGKKLEIQKFRRRKTTRKHTGHRQRYTSVRITTINVPGLEVVDQPAEAPQPVPETTEQPAASADE
jgi:large subunit ribosomal protein L21